MTDRVQFKPEPHIYKWLADLAKKGYRSVPSVVQEIIAEKYTSEQSPCTNDNKYEQVLTGGAQ